MEYKIQNNHFPLKNIPPQKLPIPPNDIPLEPPVEFRNNSMYL